MFGMMCIIIPLALLSVIFKTLQNPTIVFIILGILLMMGVK